MIKAAYSCDAAPILATGALPGGAMEMGESLTDNVPRETKEETGLDIMGTGIVGTCTDPKHIIAYTDGEVRRQFNIWYTASVLGCELRASSESTALAFIHRSSIATEPRTISV